MSSTSKLVADRRRQAANNAQIDAASDAATRLALIINLVSPKYHTRKAREYPDVIALLDSKYPSIPLVDQLVCARAGWSSIPTCVQCGGQLRTIKVGIETCSYACRQSRAEQTGKQAAAVRARDATMMERYGTTIPVHIPGVTERIVRTKRRNYNGAFQSEDGKAFHSNKMKALQKKIASSLRATHGVTNVQHIPHVIAARNEKRHQIVDTALTAGGCTLIQDSPRRITFKCNKCELEQRATLPTIRSRTDIAGTACRVCSGLGRSSHKEQQLADYISSLGVEHIRNTRDVIPNRELDIWVPSKRIGIEFCGLYWHSDKVVHKNYHKDKKKLCDDNNITLIQIFEDEWDYQRDKVENRLAHILGAHSAKLYARKLECRQIDNKTARAFVDQYHTQGRGTAAVSYGLYRGEELVACMTFSKPSRAKGRVTAEWELNRFCSSVPVTGGASKLFKRFVADHNATTVVSYSDSRWGNGELYKHLGFEFVADTPINYWYAKGPDYVRRHRFGFRKGAFPQDDLSKTEFQLRDEQGYLRIWDCGSKKFMWTAKERGED